MFFSRNNRSILAKWWWTVDKPLLSAVILLIVLGVFLSFSASPAVAVRIGYGAYHFVVYHIVYAISSLAIILVVSSFNLRWIRRMAVVLYLVAVILTIWALFAGVENKGASRWIRIFGLSLQPTEFLKPLFAVFTAWLLDGYLRTKEKGLLVLLAFSAALTLLLVFRQPDVGMTMVLAFVLCGQLFLAGLPMKFVVGLGGAVATSAVFAYLTYSHVRYRVSQMFASKGELGYQIKNSLKAFQNGGIFGKGPGEGVVRSTIPDAHTDFVFAVAGEEYGLFFCLFIVALLGFIVIRALLTTMKEKNMFLILSLAGLVCIFGIQGIVNMCSTIHLGPTKGMTLPFISYGGSSLWGSALGMGMILAITRKNVAAEDEDER